MEVKDKLAVRNRRDYQARRWLVGWGAVVREREITGDASAVPKTVSFEGGEKSGTSRSSPSSLAGVLEVYLAVEACIRPVERVLRMAIEAKYAFGCIEIPETYLYYFADSVDPIRIPAQDKAPHEPADEEPVNYERREVVYTQRTDLILGLSAVRSRVRVPDWELLHTAANSMGVGPIALLSHAAFHFERTTLPGRANF